MSNETTAISCEVDECPSNILNSLYISKCREWISKLTVKVPIFDESQLFEMYKSYCFAMKNQIGADDRLLFSNAYHNSTLQLFAELGYKRVVGIDSDRRVYDEPNYWRVKFYRDDVLNTHMPPSFFKAYFALRTINKISYNRRALSPKTRLDRKAVLALMNRFFEEASRIVKAGGFLAMSIMYSSSSVQGMAGMSIFNKDYITSMLNIAEVHGFTPLSRIELDAVNGPITCEGLECTLLFVAFKLNKQDHAELPEKVNIVSPMRGQEGITIYAENLKRRFEGIGVGVNLIKNLKDRDRRYPTILEHEPGLYWNRILWELMFDDSIYVDLHGWFYSLREIMATLVDVGRGLLSRRWLCCPRSQWNSVWRSLRHLLFAIIVDLTNLLPITLHPNTLVKTTDPDSRLTCCLKNFYVVPHIAYPDLGVRARATGLRICSFGFAMRHKNFDKVCDLALRLKIPCRLILSINTATRDAAEESLKVIAELSSKYSKFPNVEIYDGFFSERDLLELMSDCSHVVFAQEDTGGVSGSYRFPVQLGIPIIATESFQAKDSQVIRVKTLDDLDLEKLASIRENINLDDGFEYLLAVLTHRR